MVDYAKEKAVAGPLANSTFLPFLVYVLSLQKFTPKTKTSFRSEYDYIIVGAGSAGSTVASRLSEIPEIDVLLLEAGESPPVMSRVPYQAPFSLGSYIDWDIQSVPQKYSAKMMKDKQIALNAGKTVGGSSVINEMLNVRGNRRNYDGWARNGAVGWSYDEILPYFKKLESMRVSKYFNTAYHGFTGPLTIESPPYNSIFRESVIQAVEDIGYTFVDPNAADQYGIYDISASLRDGKRCSVGEAYLVDAEDRSNLDIISKAFVTKILIENKKARGVRVNYNDAVYEVRARKEVILSAGTLHTPQLLMLSGIGPRAHLEEMKIPVVVDLPVGQNFHDHIGSVLVYKLNPNISSLVSKVQDPVNINRFALTGTGPLGTTAGTTVVGFLSNVTQTQSQGPPHYQLYIDEGNPPIAIPEDDQNTETLVNCLCMNVQPESRGSIKLNTPNPRDSPMADPNYFENPQDLLHNVQCMKTCHYIMTRKPLKDLGATLYRGAEGGCREFVDDETAYFTCLAESYGFSFHHYAGSSKMGPRNDSTTVVDPQLRVKGIDQLRVVDTSIMPKVTSGNTNVPTIMIAEKASDMIKQTLCSTPLPVGNLLRC